MVDLSAFRSGSPGDLVPITGVDPRAGAWTHAAFLPHPLATESPDLSPATYRTVADARAALAALDSTSRHLPNPRLFRRPALQAEAQSTSALEGTYAPLTEVLAADHARPPSSDVREILNYVDMADIAFGWIEDGRRLTIGMLEQLQAVLVRGTKAESASSGSVRTHQVVIGQRPNARAHELPIEAARFVPAPPGLDLNARLGDLLDWTVSPDVRREIDPVVAAALAHYQFEALHPFHDGNGRIGRLLVVLHLLQRGVLLEPTLTVSPWFEARREQYYDELLAVSTDGSWDSFVRFFANGLEASARLTHQGMLRLVDAQKDLKEVVRESALRADTAQTLVDYAMTNVSFTVRDVERDLRLSYGRANGLVNQLVQLGVLAEGFAGVARRFYAPRVYEVLLGRRPPVG